MRKFADKTGAKWDLDLNIGEVFRVKAASEGKFDLLEMKKVDGQELGELLDRDEGAFWELLCHLMESQILKREQTIAEFGQLLAADCWPVIKKLFFEEWCDFFRHLQRPDRADPLEKMVRFNAKAMELVEARLADKRLGTELDDKMTAKMEAVLNQSFGDLLVSLDKTLSLEPSAN